MEWTRGPVIGRGSTAAVYLATAVATGERFAVKTGELASSEFLLREQAFLCQLNSPYIVKYMGFEVGREGGEPSYNLFMEYLPFTLHDEIQRRGGRLEESLIRSYTRQILMGLDYLHGKGVVHCDVKSRNILLGREGAKIADFGCARWLEKRPAFSGTPAFMAPEVVRGEEQGFEADVWALGCTVIEMATGRNPWSEVNDPVSAMYRIGFSGEVPECSSRVSQKAQDFLNRCLNREAKKRWTVQELLEHPFLASAQEEERESAANSPSSVLDQSFWESMEASEVESSADQKTQMNSSLNSPAERIRKLAVNASSSVSGGPSWSRDEDWVTVRSNETEKTMNFSEEEEKPFSDPTGSDSPVIHDEEQELVSLEFLDQGFWSHRRTENVSAMGGESPEEVIVLKDVNSYSEKEDSLCFLQFVSYTFFSSPFIINSFNEQSFFQFFELNFTLNEH